MVSKKEKIHKLKKSKVQATRVVVSTAERLKKLSKPTKDFTVNELVVSNLIRGLEMQMAKKSAEKVLNDSELLKKSYGKTLVFVGDVSGFEEEASSDKVELGYLSVVGERVGSVMTPIKGSISNLVAESFKVDLGDMDFQKLTGKILLGTTIMFSAKVNIVSDEVSLEGIQVQDFGFRVFQENGAVDSLAIFNDLVDTYKYEYYNVESGIVTSNTYRNTSLDSYIDVFAQSETQKPLEQALEYILGTYDEGYKKSKTTLWGIIKEK